MPINVFSGGQAPSFADPEADRRVLAHSLRPESEDEDLSFGDYFGDVAQGIVHGSLGFVESVVDLGADIGNAAIGGFESITNTDVDLEFEAPDLNANFAPQTFVGGMASGVAQFLVGFGVAGKILGAASKITKAGRTAAEAAKAAGPFGKGLAKGAVADFISFQEHEARLANFMVEVPALRNPITEYLAADPEDGWAEGRLKNALEGAGLGIITDSVLAGIKGFRGMKGLEGEELVEATKKANQEVSEATQMAANRSRAEAAEKTVKETEASEAAQAARVASDNDKIFTELERRIAKGESLEDAIEATGPVRVGKLGLDKDAEAVLELHGQHAKRLSRMMGEDEQLRMSNKVALELAEESGHDIGSVFARLSGEGATIEGLTTDLIAARGAIADLADDLHKGAVELDLAKQAGRATDAMRAELVVKSNRLNEAYEIVARAQRSAARATQAAKVKPLRDATDILEVISRSGGLKNIDNLAEDLIALGAGNRKGMMKRINKGKFWGVANEYRINALLSNPTTHVVNALSNTLNTFILPTEKLVGGVLTGDKALIREGLSTFVGLGRAVKDSLRMMWQSFKRDNPLVDSRPTNELSELGPQIGSNRDDMLGHALNFMGGVTRLPSRFLGGSDEFFKQINYRGFVHQKAVLEALEKGLTGKEAAEYAAKRVDNAFDNTGRGIDDDAIAYAREATFTSPLTGLGKSAQEFVNRHPSLRMVVPFIRTPTNILKAVIERTPIVGAALRDVRNELAAGGVRRSKMLAKWYMGSMFYTAGIALAAEGRITGRGPEDFNQRQVLQATGWQPYSLVFEVDGKKQYHSYNRLDPFGMFIGLVADYTELANSTDEDTRNNLASAALSATIRNLTNKTYLVGLTDFFRAMDSPDRAMPRYIQNMFASFNPSLVRQVNKTWFDDAYRETRTMFDGVYARTPGFSKDLDPRRNIFGEIVHAPDALGWDFMSPFALSRELGDEAAEELSRLDHSFRPPSARMGGVDLREFDGPGGKSLYDRLQVLTGTVRVGGRTMKEALEKMIASDTYQRLPDHSDGINPTGRISMVNKILTLYKSAARRKLRAENSELNDLINQHNQRILDGQRLGAIRDFIGGQ